MKAFHNPQFHFFFLSFFLFFSFFLLCNIPWIFSLSFFFLLCNIEDIPSCVSNRFQVHCLEKGEDNASDNWKVRGIEGKKRKRGGRVKWNESKMYYVLLLLIVIGFVVFWTLVIQSTLAHHLRVDGPDKVMVSYGVSILDSVHNFGFQPKRTEYKITKKCCNRIDSLYEHWNQGRPNLRTYRNPNRIGASWCRATLYSVLDRKWYGLTSQVIIWGPDHRVGLDVVLVHNHNQFPISFFTPFSFSFVWSLVRHFSHVSDRLAISSTKSNQIEMVLYFIKETFLSLLHFLLYHFASEYIKTQIIEPNSSSHMLYVIEC